MPAPHPVPLRSTAHHRLAEQGRIRTGVRTQGTSKSGKAYEAPKAIPWFRFTSKDRSAIEQLAVAYGGQVLDWTNGWDKAAYQVTTEATRIRIALPPEPFGDGPWYEHWDGGTCQRRCDGVTVRLARTGPDGPEMVEEDCLCQDRLVCKPKTRLNVVLPELTPFVGFWRLETSSDHALREMPAAAQMILEAQGRGISFGFLELQERSSRRWDERQQKWHTAHYTVPVLSPATSFDALLVGGSRAQGLGPAGSGRPALAAGPAVSPFDPDEVDVMAGYTPGAGGVTIDEGDQPWRHHDAGEARFEGDYEDAEVVEDSMSDAAPRPAAAARPQSAGDAAEEERYRARLTRRIHARAVTKDRPIYEAVVQRVSDGRTTTSKELTLTELDRLDVMTEAWAKGSLDITLDDGGELRVETR